MYDKEILGKRIKLLRLELNLTQQQFGEFVGASKGFIANIENSNKFPSIELLVSFADYFNVSLDYLLGRSDVRSMQTTNQPNT